jgi:hypothetical protein
MGTTRFLRSTKYSGTTAEMEVHVLPYMNRVKISCAISRSCGNKGMIKISNQSFKVMHRDRLISCDHPKGNER